MDEQFNLENLGYREIERAGRLLLAYAEYRPDSWIDQSVRLGFNRNSGAVYLVNEACQTLMLRDGKAEMWYYLSYDGAEGFIDELWEEFKANHIHPKDYEELADYLRQEHMEKEAETVERFLAREEA